MSPSTKAAASYASPSKIPETPTQRLDRLVHSTAAPLTGGLSPVSLALAMADWAWHLGVSPGRQMELAALATQLLRDTLQTRDGVADGAGAADDDPRFRHEAWASWPFSQVRAGFRNSEAFWREATRVPGMTAPPCRSGAVFCAAIARRHGPRQLACDQPGGAARRGGSPGAPTWPRACRT